MDIVLIEHNAKRKKRLRSSLEVRGYSVAANQENFAGFDSSAAARSCLALVGVGAENAHDADLFGSLLDKNIKGMVYTIVVAPEGASIEKLRRLFPVDDFLMEPFSEEELTSRVQIGTRILSLEADLREARDKIRALSSTDPLTGCYSRSYLDEHLPHEIKRAMRYGRSLSVIAGDIDHLEAVCGIWGGGMGDRMLIDVGVILRESVRRNIDWVARDDQSGFIVVLPETEQAGAICLAQRLQRRINEQRWAEDEIEIRVTAGFGIAELSSEGIEEPGKAAENLLSCARKYLKQSKREGMNRISAEKAAEDISASFGPPGIREASK